MEEENHNHYYFAIIAILIIIGLSYTLNNQSEIDALYGNITNITHNNLVGLQGGQIGQYFHLNQSTYEAIENGSLVGQKGDKGDPGSNGSQGLPGATGATGAKGDPGINGTTPTNMSMENISILTTGSPTNMSNLAQAYSFFWSTGVVEGGEINISSYNATGVTINISSGIAMVRNPPSTVFESPAMLYSSSFPATQVFIPHRVQSWLYVDFDGVSSVVKTTTAFSDIDGNAQVTLYVIFCEETNETQVADARAQNVNMGLKIRRFLYNTMPFAHTVGGNMIGNPSGLNISVTTGEYYYGLNPIVIQAFDTTLPLVQPELSGQHHFEYYYYNTSAELNWTDIDDVQRIDTLKYNPGSGLTAIGNNKYVVEYVYYELSTTQMVFSGTFQTAGSVPAHLAVLYGTTQYNSLSAALASSPPTNIPPSLRSMGILIGRVIFEKGATTLTQTDSVYSTTFTASAATNHNSLANLQGGQLNEYYHLTGAQYTNYDTLQPQITALQNKVMKIKVYKDNTGNNLVLPTGYVYDTLNLYNGTITSAEIVGDRTGSVNVSIWQSASYPPTISDSIVDSNYLMLNSQTYNTSTLVGWNTTIVKNHYLWFNINSATTTQKINIILTIGGLS